MGTPPLPYRPVPPLRRQTPVKRAVQRSGPARAHKLQLAGAVLLVAGLLTSAQIYWTKIRHPTPTIEDLLPASAKEHRRQMGILYGTVGLLAVDLSNALARPATQAVLVLLIFGGSAGLCFYVARLPDDFDDV